MSSKPSKQLGALLNRVPPATVSLPVSYTPQVAARESDDAETEPAPEPEVPLQVLVPRHVRVQLDRMHAETRKSLRILTLEALRGIGIAVSDDDIAGKRGRKKS